MHVALYLDLSGVIRNPKMKNPGYSSAYHLFMALVFTFLLLLLSGRNKHHGVAATAVNIYDKTLEKVTAGMPHFSMENQTPSATLPRKLNEEEARTSVDRIHEGGGCTSSSILVFQGPSGTLYNGIPIYSVRLENVCVAGMCTISNIHLRCGWFSSAELIDPHLFRRIDYDDCLVNDGQPLNPGEVISFQYANTFPYPMSVSNVQC